MWATKSCGVVTETGWKYCYQRCSLVQSTKRHFNAKQGGNWEALVGRQTYKKFRFLKKCLMNALLDYKNMPLGPTIQYHNLFIKLVPYSVDKLVPKFY